MKENKKRCFGSAPGKEFYAEYHDKEWGIPVYDDKHLFEMLILEGAQAGLSWETILKRREGYRKAFHYFDPAKVAKMTDDELNEWASKVSAEIVKREGAALALSASDGDEPAIEADSNLLGIAIAQAIIEAYRAGVTAGSSRIQ